MIPRLRNKPYEDRPESLTLFHLSKRRMRGDLTQVFKILKGTDNMGAEKYLMLEASISILGMI